MEAYTESQKNWLVHDNVSGMWQNCDLNIGLFDSTALALLSHINLLKL